MSMKPVKGYRCVKWPCQRLAVQQPLYKTALNGPSPCVPSPSSGLWGWGHPIYIFLIFPGHLEIWTPLQIPIWGPLLAVPCYMPTLYCEEPLKYSNRTGVLWELSALLSCSSKLIATVNINKEKPHLKWNGVRKLRELSHTRHSTLTTTSSGNGAPGTPSRKWQ